MVLVAKLILSTGFTVLATATFCDPAAVVGHCLVKGCFMGHGNASCHGTQCLCDQGSCSVDGRVCIPTPPKNVYLRNVWANEYMFQSNRRHVYPWLMYTWEPRNENPLTVKEYQFEVQQLSNGAYTMKTFLGEYARVTANKLDSNRRYMMSRKLTGSENPMVDASFQFEFTKEPRGYYKIKSRSTGEHMYAGAPIFNMYGRYVLFWIPKNEDIDHDTKCHWDVRDLETRQEAELADVSGRTIVASAEPTYISGLTVVAAAASLCTALLLSAWALRRWRVPVEAMTEPLIATSM